MDIETFTFIFILFVALFIFAIMILIIGLIVERMTKEELDFDDIEGIKRVFKEEDK